MPTADHLKFWWEYFGIECLVTEFMKILCHENLELFSIWAAIVFAASWKTLLLLIWEWSLFLKIISQTKKQELKESLLMDLNEKKKMLENLRTTMEITSTGTCECWLTLSSSFSCHLPLSLCALHMLFIAVAGLFEPKMTRKLRRRHYEPAIVPEKKRKPSPYILS